ncbi:Ff.00g054230.m01.CDS01 [Fusarium sp. VM40]|nr:Ff.00g054230.m01.CDS01 [Fusarium sp. VM40]
MLFSSRFTFALGAILSLIANVSGSGETGFPSFITGWGIFTRWQSMTDSIAQFDVPGIDDLTLGEWSNPDKKVTWMCYTVSLGDVLVPTTGTVVIEKAVLSYPGDDGNEVKETVVSKRSGETADGPSVLYGARLQKGLNHPNILPIYHYVLGKGARRSYGFAIMPLVEEGSVAANLDQYSDQASVNTAFKQMLSAVTAVSSAGIIHRDLKPENFLKDGDTIKLMDFDQSLQTGTSLQMDVGTPSYTAPEIMLGMEYTTKADTFSLAMSFLIMSVTDLRNSDTRFQLWKDLIEPSPGHYQGITASEVEKILGDRNYGVFNGNDGLLKVIAKAMCSEGERYSPADFETAFNGAT